MFSFFPEVTLILSTQSCHRYVPEAGGKGPVPCPQAVLIYNATMGGEDLSDMLMAIYRCPTRSRRWYFSLFGYCVEMAITNGYLSYQWGCVLLGEKQIYKTSKDFRIKVFQGLVAPAQVSKAGHQWASAPRPSDDLRFDMIGHFMQASVKPGRCRYCKVGWTIRISAKCIMRLCHSQFHLNSSKS